MGYLIFVAWVAAVVGCILLPYLIDWLMKDSK